MKTKEQLFAYYKQWASKNREKLKVYQKQYRQNNLQKLRERHREYNKQHPEIVKRANKKWRSKNPERFREYDKVYRLKHPKRSTGWQYKKYLKITGEKPDFCQICGSTKVICFDHNHQTGKFRGWICRNCNTAIGLVSEDIDRLSKIINYLTLHK